MHKVTIASDARLHLKLTTCSGAVSRRCDISRYHLFADTLVFAATKFVAGGGRFCIPRLRRRLAITSGVDARRRVYCAVWSRASSHWRYRNCDNPTRRVVVGSEEILRSAFDTARSPDRPRFVEPSGRSPSSLCDRGAPQTAGLGVHILRPSIRSTQSSIENCQSNFLAASWIEWHFST